MDKRNTMSKIPFFLVTGFLGSGKTTFLKHFLNRYADTCNIVVIQNEFAPGNIDGKFLAECGKKYSLVEINRGSVFCVCLLSDFKATLLDIISSGKPQMIILEATGLADPIAITHFIQSPELAGKIYLAHIWCVTDASNIIEMQHLYSRVNHQMRIADIIILNKIDTYDGDINQLKLQVQAITPFARIISSTFCELDFDALQPDPAIQPVAMQQKDNHADFESCGRPEEFGCAVVKTNRLLKRDRLIQFLKDKEREILRIKGVVQLETQQMVAVHSCFGDTKITPITGVSGPTEIIALGINLDSNKFRDDFRAVLEA
jgi:G3E family GTPase